MAEFIAGDLKEKIEGKETNPDQAPVPDTSNSPVNGVTNGAADADTTSTSNEYKIADQWHSKPHYMRVVCAGAGATGLLVAFRLQNRFRNYDLVCYEKNPEIGGTWYENRYPGCACDLPAHAYVYPFEPNPNWSQYYAGSSEILDYFKNFAEKYKLRRYVKLNHRVLSAVWDDDKGIYEVEVEVNGEKIKDWCHIFINATGFLNNWQWPSIPGLHSFSGKLMHTANWDESYDMHGRSTAVIGTGSSGIQVLPPLQKECKEVVAFMRSPTWIFPAFAGDIIEEKTEKTENKEGPDEQYIYTEEEKRKFREDPAAHLHYRKEIEVRANDNLNLFTLGSPLLEDVKSLITDVMHKRIGPGHEDLKKNIIPKWTPGCRRTTPGAGYLEALTRPNVRRVHKEIEKVTPDGLVDEDGILHKVDTIVCATGFKIAFVPPFLVKGLNGVTMEDEFNPVPKVYLALTVPKFPNYFVVNGVRGNWATGNVLASYDVQVDYIMDCLKRIQQEGIKSFEVKAEPVEQLYEHIDEYHKTSVWSDDCSSWYKGGQKKGKIWIWSGAGLHYFKTIKRVRWEHYNFRYKSNNLWTFLGDGWTEAQHARDRSRLAPYIRTSDTPWEFQDYD